jgi:5,10-methylenetetrahydromethanopterin reductase
VFSAAVPQPDAVNAADWRALLSLGSVLDEGEELTSARVVDALAPSAVVMYHAMYERGGAAVVDAVPGGRGWREAVEAHPENERHFAIHEGHLVKANPRDEPYVADLIPMASAGALTGSAEQVAARVRDLAAAGVTEVAYQPAGSDIERELRAFASATSIAD